jgi:hypothetical protein
VRVMSFLLDPPALAGFIGASGKRPPAAGTADSAAKSSGFLERLDRWFWRQQLREREAYLSGAQDIFELEDRIRRLERSVGSRYY